jgi:hypothetical protein
LNFAINSSPRLPRTDAFGLEPKSDAVAAASDVGALLANAPQAALYTSIAQFVAGTDSVEQVDAIFIGRLSIRVAAPAVVAERRSDRGRSERGGR